MKLIGYINDDTSPEGVKHFGIVLQGSLPIDFKLSDFGQELSINDLKFMSIDDIWSHFYEFEFWSQLVIRSLFKPILPVQNVIIKPSKFNITSNIIVFVGEIASGKTVLCELLKDKLGFKIISTPLMIM